MATDLYASEYRDSKMVDVGEHIQQSESERILCLIYITPVVLILLLLRLSLPLNEAE